MVARAKMRPPAPPRRRVRLAVVLVILALVGLVGASLPASRAWWRAGESSELGAGLALLGQRGCMACHTTAAGCIRWRADGRPPESVDVVRDAVLHGRSRVAGFPADMPAAAGALSRRGVDRVVLAVSAREGQLRDAAEPEVEAGREVMLQLGCESCHGLLGAGGVANAGSLSGQVPGWLGRSFARVEAQPGGVDAVIRDGSTPQAVPFSGGPALVMPAFHGRLDSTELGLLTEALQGARRSARAQKP